MAFIVGVDWWRRNVQALEIVRTKDVHEMTFLVPPKCQVSLMQNVISSVQNGHFAATIISSNEFNRIVKVLMRWGYIRS